MRVRAEYKTSGREVRLESVRDKAVEVVEIRSAPTLVVVNIGPVAGWGTRVAVTIRHEELAALRDAMSEVLVEAGYEPESA